MTTNSFVIAIPSHNRLKELESKTLQFLKDSNLYGSIEIYIFVADEEYSSYFEKYNREKDKVLVIKSVLGLNKQRNFMRDYFDENKKILYLDDDINGIQMKDETEQITNLKKIIKTDFIRMGVRRCFLGSINPTNNLYFCNDNITNGLYLCVGCYYYEINKKNKCLYLDEEKSDEKEDYRRSITFYNFFGSVYRNDTICVKHKYNGTVGGMNDQNRIINNDKVCQELRDKYPNLCMITNKSDKLELRFVRNNQRFTNIHAKKIFEPVEAVYYNIDKEYTTLDKNKNYKIFDKKDGNKLKAIILRNVLEIDILDTKVLNKITKKGSNNRGNIAGSVKYERLPNDIKKKVNKDLRELTPCNIQYSRYTFKEEEFQFGNNIPSGNIGNTKHNGEYKEMGNNKVHGEEFKNGFYELSQNISNNAKIHFPGISINKMPYLDTIFSGITINKSVRSACHYDCLNRGWSAMVVIKNQEEGEDFKGADLLFPEYKINCNLQMGKDIILFNAKETYHANSKYIVKNKLYDLNEDTNRFSMVYFVSNRM
jgi:hypothetical protein